MKKKPYKKPEIKEVNLVAEEEVLGTCKNDLGQVPTRANA